MKFRLFLTNYKTVKPVEMTALGGSVVRRIISSCLFGYVSAASGIISDRQTSSIPHDVRINLPSTGVPEPTLKTNAPMLKMKFSAI